MIEFTIPILGFVAASGTGKTTLLARLIPMLKQKGHHIALIKHSHHNIDIDQPGKDSYRLRKAGAEQTIIASPKRTSIIIEHPDMEDSKLSQVLKHLQTETLDLVIVEGFKYAAIPKIELHRKVLNKPYFYQDDENIIALATDALYEPELAEFRSIEQLDINQPGEITAWIENKFF